MSEALEQKIEQVRAAIKADPTSPKVERLKGKLAALRIANGEDIDRRLTELLEGFTEAMKEIPSEERAKQQVVLPSIRIDAYLSAKMHRMASELRTSVTELRRMAYSRLFE